MAISKTDILNKALTLVGAAPCTDIDDDTNNARILARVYETALRSVLSETKWNFATTRCTLSVVSVTDAFTDPGESYVYQKPLDMIRIWGTNDPSATWREEGDYIYSDTSGLGLRYVYYLDTPSKYPSYFVDAFVDRLCSDISFAIVNSSTLGDKYKQLYESVSLPKAQAANAQTGMQQQPEDAAWLNARFMNESPDA
jgi:hypothetical protein